MAGEDILVGMLLGGLLIGILFPIKGVFWYIQDLRRERDDLAQQLDSRTQPPISPVGDQQ